MEISLNLVKELREKTGVGMADCKKALVETDGDIQKAIEYLRKKGAATAAKRADKIVKEGAVKSYYSPDKKNASIIELNCETDFVAKGEDFQKFSDNIAEAVVKIENDDINELLKFSIDGLTIQQHLDSLMAKLGEKLELKRAKLFKSDNGFVAGYIHFGSKLGALISFDGNYSDEGFDLGNKIAMQVVAMNPIALDRQSVPSEIIEKEKEIYLVQTKDDKKPQNIIDRIVLNKIEKFYQENCLLEQEYIQESSKNIQKLVDEFNKSKSNNLIIKQFIRYQLGS